MFRNFIPALVLAGLSAPAFAQDVASWTDRIDPQTLVQGSVELDLHVAGETDGFMRFGWYTEGDVLHVWDRTMWPSQAVYETYEARSDSGSLAPHGADIRFHQGDSYYTIDADFEPGRATGLLTATTPGQPVVNQVIDTELPEGTLLRAMIFVLAAVVPLDPGESISIDWYAPMSNDVSPVTLSAAERVQIDTPGGRFDTIRLEVRGGSPDNDIYVEPETRRIVRIDVEGQPMQFLAPAETE